MSSPSLAIYSREPTRLADCITKIKTALMAGPMGTAGGVAWPCRGTAGGDGYLVTKTSTDISTRRFLARASDECLESRGRCSAKPWEVTRLGSILLLASSRWTTDTARAEDRSQLDRNLDVEMGVFSLFLQKGPTIATKLYCEPG